VQNGSSFTAGDTDLVNNGNLALMSTPLAIFRCPSDTGDPAIPADTASPNPFNSPFTPIYGPGGDYTGAKTSYDFVTYAEFEMHFCNSWPQQVPARRCMFGQNSNCKIALVTDGMSNTFMLAETCFRVNAGIDGNHGCGTAWGYRSAGMAGIDTSWPGINVWDVGAYGTLAHARSPGSMHQGGCHFALGDGSVRWVSQSVGFGVLGQMSTIAGGEAANTD
jgi:Protein of unknown function (DUF1559)